MLSLVLCVPLSILNRMRGSDKIEKWQFGLYSAGFIEICLFLGLNSITPLEIIKITMISIIMGACLFWWSVFGWGRYFTAGHGDFIKWNNESDDPFVDFISDLIFGRSLTTFRQAKNAGTFAMCLRAWGLYPGFIFAAYVSGCYYIYLLGLLVFTQGLFYRLASKVFSTLDFINPAERSFGFFLGLVIGSISFFI